MSSNRLIFVSILIITILFTASQAVHAEKPPIPSLVVPDGLGYNIHFTDPKPGEMEMLADSGATIIRMDFGWGGTEREKGVYDFSSFDRLTAALEKHRIRPLYILDYSNRHYDQGLSPHSEEGRAAFAKWATAGVERFKDRGILWEMYNEPNIHFWKPKPDPEKYILLALEVGKAIRKVAPNELYIGPATSEIDFEFLEKCFKAGLLEYWDAVSVHPYRQRAPETVIPEYAKLKAMIEKYAPEGKTIPILSAEWGYSSVWGNYNDEIQGKMLPRQWMVNLACDVPISIWYDWHDDGTDPKEPEHHFGTTNYAYHKDRTPVYDPKPSYIAAKTFTDTFRGFRYNKRIGTGDENDFVFLFSKDGKGDQKSEHRLAIWTLDKKEKTIKLRCGLGKFRVVSYLGEPRDDVQTVGNTLLISISDGPLYLIPDESEAPNEFLHEIVKEPSIPLALYVSTKTFAEQMKPFGEQIQFSAPRNDFHVRISSTIGTGDESFSLLQPIQLIAAEPISVSWEPRNDRVLLHLSNPTGVPHAGPISFAYYTPLYVVDGEVREGLHITNESIQLEEGEISYEKSFPVKFDEKGCCRIAYSISGIQYDKKDIRLKPFENFSEYTAESFKKTWGVFPDGDAKVGSEILLKFSDKNPEQKTAEITYRFEDGWKFLRFAPKNEQRRKIEGIPKAFHVRLNGDASGNSVRMRVRDSKGQTFQMGTGKLSVKGPESFTFSLTDSSTFHWGGPNDGKVYAPIEFDSLIIDGTRTAFGPSTVSVLSIVFEYE